MKEVNFKQLCNGIHHSACVISVQKLKDGYGEIRIVEGNDAYTSTFNADFYTKHDFIPNSIYTDYLVKNLNFEEYCYLTSFYINVRGTIIKIQPGITNNALNGDRVCA